MELNDSNVKKTLDDIKEDLNFHNVTVDFIDIEQVKKDLRLSKQNLESAKNNISNINKFWNKDVKLTSPEGKSMKKENAKLIKLLNNELKKLGVQADFKESLRFTGATTRIN